MGKRRLSRLHWPLLAAPARRLQGTLQGAALLAHLLAAATRRARLLEPTLALTALAVVPALLLLLLCCRGRHGCCVGRILHCGGRGGSSGHQRRLLARLLAPVVALAPAPALRLLGALPLGALHAWLKRARRLLWLLTQLGSHPQRPPRCVDLSGAGRLPPPPPLRAILVRPILLLLLAARLVRAAAAAGLALAPILTITLGGGQAQAGSARVLLPQRGARSRAANLPPPPDARKQRPATSTRSSAAHLLLALLVSPAIAARGGAGAGAGAARQLLLGAAGVECGPYRVQVVVLKVPHSGLVGGILLQVPHAWRRGEAR